MDNLDKILNYIKVKNYFWDLENFNIVYIEGMDSNGKFNLDEPNQFNDVRILFKGNRFVGAWEATTEPGRYYTQNPMNQKGAARIAFGQFKAWRVGTHGNSEPHEALVQVGLVKVYRDANKDMMRSGDAIEEGYFGINQHWGYDLPRSNIGLASAGCLVGRSRSGHREFMRVIKTDKRYLINNSFIFSTIIIPGDKL